jgi:hypothetical protein
MRRSTHLLLIGLLCTAYLGIEISYIVRLPLVMDEFGTARSIWEAAEKVPYRDYAPPKTVLGYYFLAPLLRSIDAVWPSLIAVKVQIAVSFALALFVAFGFWPREGGRSAASILALLVLVPMSTFLERSAELRVDPLMAVCALLAAWALARRRVVAAGVIAGVALLVTQKSVYIVVAAGFGLVVATWMHAGWRPAMFAIVRYGGAVAAVLASYIAVWWVVSGDLIAVLRPTFYDENIVKIATGDLYPGIRQKFWSQTFLRNPLFWLLSLLAIGERLVRARTARWGELAAATTAAALLVLSVMHKQPWPYFFVLVIPVLALAQIGWFRACLDRCGSRGKVSLAVLIVIAVAWPLHRVPTVLARDQAYQRETVELADAILGPGDVYVDGVGMAYRHEQAVEAIRWLDAPRLGEIGRFSPADQEALLGEIRASSGKLLIMNYRIAALPPAAKEPLDRRFAHLAGGVFIYAPIVSDGDAEIDFGGTYFLPPEAPALRIEGRSVRPGETVALERGTHSIVGGPARLVLTPAAPLPEASNRPLRPLFDRVYDY